MVPVGSGMASHWESCIDTPGPVSLAAGSSKKGIRALTSVKPTKPIFAVREPQAGSLRGLRGGHSFQAEGLEL